MDALNFLKFWRNHSTTNTTIPTTTTTTTTTTTIPHLMVETDTDSDEDDSFFDLELTLHNFDNKENITKKTDNDPQFKTTSEVNKTAKVATDDVDSVTLSMSSNEPISKRKVLPIEPNSKPQSPISLLRSAPSFRIFTFGKQRRTAPQKTEETCGKNHKKETKVFAAKLNVEDFHCSPTLSRDNSTRSFASKLRNQSNEEHETKPERFSKEGMQKYLKMIKPLYVKVSKRYSDKVKFSGEGFMASPSSSPSVASVSSRKEKQGSFPVGIRGVSKHLGKSRSAGTVVGVSSPANRNDDTLQQQNDGIQSAILHCKRSFNSRDSSSPLYTEGSMCSMRNSFEGKL